MRRQVTIDMVAITVGWVGFFAAEVLIHNELFLTLLASLLSIAILVRAERGEFYLFGLGVLLGLTIEVGLGQVARLQHWDHASLFGVPFWLPIIWGFGFVAMRRIGNIVVQIFSDGA